MTSKNELALDFQARLYLRRDTQMLRCYFADAVVTHYADDDLFLKKKNPEVPGGTKQYVHVKTLDGRQSESQQSLLQS